MCVFFPHLPQTQTACFHLTAHFYFFPTSTNTFFPCLEFEDNQACWGVDGECFDIRHLLCTLISPSRAWEFFSVFDVPRSCNLISVIPCTNNKPLC